MGRKNLGSNSNKQKRTEEQNPQKNLGSNSKKQKLTEEQNPLLLNNLPSKWKKSWTLVTSLDLDCPDDVHENASELPMFPNLTSLALGAGFVGWEWLAQFLEKSPCLETLVFKKGYQIEHDRFGYGYDNEDYADMGDDKLLLSHPPQKVPSCLLSNLKVINFVEFQGDDRELKIVEYFLKNAVVLEKLIIRMDGTVDECFDIGAAGCAVAERLLEVTTKLLVVPRHSRTCRIEFVIDRHDFSIVEPY